ncbi:PPOX class F420-dependent enzyme/OxyR family protein [Streptomyces rishiriensis]|uniref:PPOX class F420-dependent enzyme/OxyR family protein n=1 Tax=Streptomyces rishiriensis TaxID=68264 RepID=A0ABU0P1S9_STRRH|nr:PPOX class F420-dependent enzyme/OxyR family protein [Streptomyces rishiriensis]
MSEWSATERAYLVAQRLGRLATVDPSGQPQANPVGFFLQEDGTILIGGFAMGQTKKWRNLRKNPKVALVVDDVVSLKPWTVRGVDIRGEAELLVGPHELGPHFSEEGDPHPPQADPQLGARGRLARFAGITPAAALKRKIAAATTTLQRPATGH